MDEDAAVDESPPTSPARSVRARAASPPAAERKEGVDISKHVAMMRARSKENDLEGAMQVFRKLQSSGVQLTALAYNALLDSCVQCGKVHVALQHFKEMQDLGLVDVVSYNTLLKAYLKQGQIVKARKLLGEMAENNIQANQVTYNEMLNALVTVKDRKEMWALVREMNAMGMRPNSVTCSIILKSLTSHSAPDDVRQAMALIDNLHEDMDEVLFASVIEACVRVGQLDLLSSKLQQYAGLGGLAGLTAPTYGSMIKAYGRARDIERVRELWHEMRRRHVTPTSITLGCMIDALVNNGFPDEALSLVREIREDETCKDILNTVIYSTLLKGFAQSRQPGRVQDVFEEMKQMGIACNTVSYNTMLDANARTGKMDRADELFRDMQACGVSPDVITYSTLVKGYCQAGDIDQGFQVLKDGEEWRPRARRDPVQLAPRWLREAAPRRRCPEARGGHAQAQRAPVELHAVDPREAARAQPPAEPGVLHGGGDVQALRPPGEHPRLHVLDFRVLPEPPDAAGFAAPRFDDHRGRCRAGRAHLRRARTGLPQRRVLREGRQRRAGRLSPEPAGPRHAEARAGHRESR